ncbi:hypothetical protein NLX67_16980 [Domibacillus sp. A3M-37]|uniref:hypothetical protein n=1 Tax=Domibacillus sp. A3M-37 TaxID=2962037 RepID=UPI0020B81E4C|nr:hypothetical protein [Domibacillus sp. A3M-37]MCP3764050.1 hypothetical protein [Domibacillus sp. A3M-37]
MESEFERDRRAKLLREAGIEVDDKIDPNIPIFKRIYMKAGDLHYELKAKIFLKNWLC